MHLGATIDPELDGQPMINAVGDDNDGMNDEDGVTFPPVWQPGSNVIINVTAAGVPAGAAAFLNAWVDFNGNGNWTEANEHIIIGHPLSNGVNIISRYQFSEVVISCAVGRTEFRFIRIELVHHLLSVFPARRVYLADGDDAARFELEKVPEKSPVLYTHPDEAHNNTVARLFLDQAGAGLGNKRSGRNSGHLLQKRSTVGFHN